MLKLSKYKSVKTMVQSYEKSAVPKLITTLYVHFTSLFTLIFHWLVSNCTNLLNVAAPLEHNQCPRK